jgi:hypothetical protein
MNLLALRQKPLATLPHLAAGGFDEPDNKSVMAPNQAFFALQGSLSMRRCASADIFNAFRTLRSMYCRSRDSDPAKSILGSGREFLVDASACHRLRQAEHPT